MSKIVLELQAKGYTIKDVISPKKFSDSIHYYIPKSLKSYFENKVLLVLKKDNETLLIAEE